MVRSQVRNEHPGGAGTGRGHGETQEVAADRGRARLGLSSRNQTRSQSGTFYKGMRVRVSCQGPEQQTAARASAGGTGRHRGLDAGGCFQPLRGKRLGTERPGGAGELGPGMQNQAGRGRPPQTGRESGAGRLAGCRPRLALPAASYPPDRVLMHAGC